MTARTSERLAQVLHALALFELEKLARADMFHDFLSPYDLPEMELEARLRAARDACPDKERRDRIEEVRQRHMQGEFDADFEESEAWAQSDEGKDAFNRLIKGDK